MILALTRLNHVLWPTKFRVRVRRTLETLETLETLANILEPGGYKGHYCKGVWVRIGNLKKNIKVGFEC